MYEIISKDTPSTEEQHAEKIIDQDSDNIYTTGHSS